MNNSPSPTESPSMDGRGRGRLLAVGLFLAVALVGGIIWGTSQSSSNNPAGLAGPSPAGVATPTETATAAPVAPEQTPAAAAPEQAPATTAPAAAPDSPPAPEPGVLGAAPAPASSSDLQLANVDQPVAAPVPLNDTVSIQDGVTAEITRLESVQGQAQKAGEVAGPSLRFTVTIHNGTARPISTADVVVNVNAGPEELPAITLSGPDVTSFPATVAPGESGSSTYVFLVPVDQRDRVQVLVNYQVGSPIAAFEGAAPTEGKP